MGSVQDAASLFGSNDPASDPFASLGADTSASSATSTEGDFFAQTDPISQGVNGHSGHVNAWAAPVPTQQYQPPSAYAQNYSQQPSNVQAQGAHAAQTQWSGSQGGQPPAPVVSPYSQSSYAPQQSYTPSTHSTQSYAPSGQQTQPYAPSQQYAPGGQGYTLRTNNYAPTTHTYNPSAIAANPYSPYSQTKAQPTQAAQSTYDPYKPAASGAYDAYKPATASAYDPYKPSTSSLKSPVSPPSHPSYTQQPTSIIPPPPKPAVALNRPKTLNAYDPPFPVSKQNRRGKPSQPPPATPQAYPPYQSTNTPLPPPPRSPASTSMPRRDSQSRSHTAPSSHAQPHAPSMPQATPPFPSSASNTVAPSHGYASNGSSNGNAHLPRTDASYFPEQLRASDDPTSATAHVPDIPKVGSPPALSKVLNDRTTQPAAQPEREPVKSTPMTVQVDLDPESPPGYRTSFDYAIQPATAIHTSSLQNNGLEPHLESSKDIHDEVFADDELRALTPPQAEPEQAFEPVSRIDSPEAMIGDGVAKINGYTAHPPNGVTGLARPASPAQYPVPYPPAALAQIPYAPPSLPHISPYEPLRKASTSPTQTKNGVATPPNPYAPNNYAPNPYAPNALHRPSEPRNRSPPTSSQYSSPPPPNTYTPSPYAPSAETYAPNPPGRPTDSRDRSMSTSSQSSTSSHSDPYAPVKSLQRHATEPTNYMPRYDAPNPYPAPPVSQVIALSAPTHSAYAPSPSLMGLNDPLGRSTARIPVISFGFGGKLVTCFHGSSVLNTGFDVALSSRKSMDINIRTINKLIPESALDPSTAVFPGPLFSDPGTPSVTSLVRTGGATQIKNKKAKVLKYLVERIEELSQGLGYLHNGSEEMKKLDGKVVLVRLLKVLVENDGGLTGSAQIDKAVRMALVPKLEHDVVPDVPTSMSFGTVPNNSSETPIAVTTLRPSSLDKIQEFLMRGERQKAYHYALDEKLWAHAMLIASSIDKGAWKDVVNEFLKNELRQPQTLNPADVSYNDNGREGLRVAYSVFSGQGSTSVLELLPPNNLSKLNGSSLQVASVPVHMTPLTPNFPPTLPPQSANLPHQSLARWSETAAMLLSSPMTTDASFALTSLGDCLMANHWNEAAHACYLLSPQTSPIGGAGNAAARVVLVGASNPLNNPNFHKDSDALIFSEIAEFAFSLAPAVKGQEAFGGFPHLQAYRLIRATALAETGHATLANRYCDAIVASLGRNSPYFTPNMQEQLKGLKERLVATPQISKTGSWLPSKMSRPSYTSLGSWVEGGITKLITGDVESTDTKEIEGKAEERTFSGPFSQYSAISSTTTSARASPAPTFENMYAQPPPRSGSAMGYQPPSNSYPAIDRASSAMDHVRRKPSPNTYGQLSTPQPFSNSYSPSSDDYGTPEMMTPRPPDHAEIAGASLDAGWGALYDNDVATPTASSFNKGEGSSASHSKASSYMDDDEEDLGFGNSKPKKAKEDEAKPSGDDNNPKKEEAKAPPQVKPASSGSWFSLGRLWGGRESTPGPVKAKLGDDRSFYYDEKLRKWINKNAPATDTPVAPPPPPPRSQTASPGRAAGLNVPGNGLTPAQTPVRPASAFESGGGPPGGGRSRLRSSLVPMESSDSGTSTPVSGASTPPTSTGTPPPGPPTRPKSSVAKRNIRSRYVVYQGEDTPP